MITFLRGQLDKNVTNSSHLHGRLSFNWKKKKKLQKVAVQELLLFWLGTSRKGDIPASVRRFINEVTLLNMQVLWLDQ